MLAVGMHFTNEENIDSSECGESSLTNATLTTILKKDAMQKDMLSEKGESHFTTHFKYKSFMQLYICYI